MDANEAGAAAPASPRLARRTTELDLALIADDRVPDGGQTGSRQREKETNTRPPIRLTGRPRGAALCHSGGGIGGAGIRGVSTSQCSDRSRLSSSFACAVSPVGCVH